jgi:hypothetical protein
MDHTDDDINKLYEEFESKLDQFRKVLVDKANYFIDIAIYDWCKKVLAGETPTREELKDSVAVFIEKQHKELSEKLEKNHP